MRVSDAAVISNHLRSLPDPRAAGWREVERLSDGSKYLWLAFPTRTEGAFFMRTSLNESQNLCRLPLSILDQYRARKQAQQAAVITRLAGHLAVSPARLQAALWAERVDLEQLTLDAMEVRR